MKYANIEIGTREVAVYSASGKDARLTQRLEARGRMDEVYNRGVFSIDSDRIFSTALEGLRAAGEVDRVTVTCQPDAVVILDEDDRLLFPVLARRDPGLDQVDLTSVDTRAAYMKSGALISTTGALSRILASRSEDAHLFRRAATYMFLGDYLRYQLTGVKATDRTLAQAAGLADYSTGAWLDEVFSAAELENLFPAFAQEDSVLGSFTGEVEKEVGYSAQVVMIPSLPLALAPRVLDLELAVTSYLDGKIVLGNSSAEVDGSAWDDGVMNIRAGEGCLVCLPFAGYDLIDRVRRQSAEGTTYDTIENLARENKVFEYVDIRDGRLSSGDVVDAVNSILDENGKEKAEREVAIGVLYNSIARYTVGSMMILDRIGGRHGGGGHQVVAVLGNHPVEFGDFIRTVLEVGVHRDDHISFSFAEATVQSRRFAIIPAKLDAFHIRRLGTQLFDDFPRTVGASVIDKNHFISEVMVRHHTFDPSE